MNWSESLYVDFVRGTDGVEHRVIQHLRVARKLERQSNLDPLAARQKLVDYWHRLDELHPNRDGIHVDCFYMACNKSWHWMLMPRVRLIIEKAIHDHAEENRLAAEKGRLQRAEKERRAKVIKEEARTGQKSWFEV